jgi:L,D-transpeptidase catalytic domain
MPRLCCVLAALAQMSGHVNRSGLVCSAQAVNDATSGRLELLRNFGHIYRLGTEEPRRRFFSSRTMARWAEVEMRSFLVAFTGLILFASHAAQAKVDITIDKNTQTMTVAVDGVQRYRWPVSTGIPSRETPNGSFRAFRMEEDHFSKEFDDAPMPHSIFFTKIGHAIHGTVYENKIGTPASHGCVRLSQANATTLYALVEEQGVLNTTVTLTGSAQIALARNPRGITTAMAGHELPQPGDQTYQPQYQTYQQQYSQQQNSAAGEPVDITPQQSMQQSRVIPQQRGDDGYICLADGSSDQRIYPAPPAGRRLYNAQAYPAQQPQPYYSNNGYNDPSYTPPGYYQPRPVYQPRRYYYNQN